MIVCIQIEKVENVMKEEEEEEESAAVDEGMG